ncbi:MAG: ETC complex I subunit [Rickettsiales bacterium]|nr:ETC complex I subunit [Rickettsiales bacterium]
MIQNDRKAIIYSPAKTAMQSGKSKTGRWKIRFEPIHKKSIDDLMGWTGSDDMLQELNLSFADKEAAIDYAKRNELVYEVIDPNESETIIKSYSDNFTRQPKNNN